MEDYKTLNQEYKERIAYEIQSAISQARKGQLELSLEEIGAIIKDNFTEEELVELKKYL
jgi:hypothetical protein